MEGEDKAEEQEKEVIVEEADVVVDEDKAEEQEQEKKVIVEADVEWVVVEKESASDAFAEHGDVQSDDVVSLDIDIQAQEGGSAKC